MFVYYLRIAFPFIIALVTATDKLICDRRLQHDNVAPKHARTEVGQVVLTAESRVPDGQADQLPDRI